MRADPIESVVHSVHVEQSHHVALHNDLDGGAGRAVRLRGDANPFGHLAWLIRHTTTGPTVRIGVNLLQTEWGVASSRTKPPQATSSGPTKIPSIVSLAVPSSIFVADLSNDGAATNTDLAYAARLPQYGDCTTPLRLAQYQAAGPKQSVR